MKKYLFFAMLLVILAACVPKGPPQPVVQPDPVAGPSESNDEDSPQTFNVDIRGFSYEPAEVKIKVGDTVVWTQRDGGVKHNVEIVSGPESFKADLMNTGESFSHTFTLPGEYSYKCTPHPNMRGKVIVE